MTSPPDALKARNLEYFRAFAPSMAETLGAYSPQSELAARGGGEWDVLLGGQSAYHGKGRAFTQSQLEAYLRSPDRLALERPGARQFDVYAERFFDTLVRSAQEAGLKVTDEHQTEDGYFLIVFGAGLGFHLGELAERSNCRYLLIADQDMEFLHHSLSTFDWAELIGGLEARGARINFVIDSRPVELARSVFANIFLNNPCSLDGSWIYRHRETPEMDEAVAQLKADLGAMYGNLGHFYDELLMLKNTYLNLRQGTSAVFKRPGKPPAAPAIVAASGPSLDKDLGVLKEIQDRAVIISSGSALRPLLRAGIIPDFHVEMENIDVLPMISQVAQDFDLSAITLVAATTVDPGVLDYFGRMIFFLRPELSPFPLFEGGAEFCLPNPDPTVANTALSFAQEAGFPEIYFFGVDLGVVDPDHHHSRESYHYTDDPIVVPEDLTFDIEAAGNFGEGRLTSRGLYTAGVSITMAIGKDVRGIEFFNCSDGILIDGAEPKAADTLDLAEIPGGKEATVAALFAAFPVLEKDRFDAAWQGDELVAAAAATAENLTEAFDGADFSSKAYLTRLMAVLKPNMIGLATEGAGPEGAALLLYRGTVYMMLIGLDYLLNRMTPRDIETFAPLARDQAKALIEYMAGTAGRVLADPLSEELPEEDSPLNRPA